MIISKKARNGVILRSIGLLACAGMALVAGCGGNNATLKTLLLTGSTKSIVVPDAGNNRVLLYTPPVTIGGSASVVLGQSGFTTATTGTTQSTLSGPSGFTFDSAGNLYVTDADNCRVLQFKPPFTTGMNASMVFGKPDFTTGGCTPTAPPAATTTNLNAPNAVAVDANGNLWVADSGYSRVVEYAAPLSSGMAISLAIGQATTTSGGTCSGGTATTTSLCSPQGIAFDVAGNLWVSDSNANRVLEFTPPFSTNMTASLELGQPAATAFTSSTANNGGILNSSLDKPAGLAFDSKGNLWVVDSSNSRVLEFQPSFSNGMAAAAVMGQTTFSTGTSNQGLSAPTSTTLSNPQGIEIDSTDKIFIGDTGNNRTITLNNLGDAQDAPVVLGQPSFTVNTTSAPSAASQNAPFAAGPSLIALTVFVMLVAAWLFFSRRKKLAGNTSAA